jgi:hypothetical protein
VTLEVGRINVCSFGHQPLGDVLVPARMFETPVDSRLSKRKAQLAWKQVL